MNQNNDKRSVGQVDKNLKYQHRACVDYCGPPATSVPGALLWLPVQQRHSSRCSQQTRLVIMLYLLLTSPALNEPEISDIINSRVISLRSAECLRRLHVHTCCFWFNFYLRVGTCHAYACDESVNTNVCECVCVCFVFTFL